ncbi:CubicO group peptidase (beta-lactamase class C family) [Nocardiopsis sp. Huas11]|uniref:serine hydrolase domain-containing protein n=1 Tax=Nocardiopsis sp. Huas11 TaxID=2183912 RepID=UPI000F1CD74C|nr:serine hydrolase domain-containing protein [Nocardiopsis sp. Huas11]RKS07989.1 CubicO group peptidase (beta-lactamase class C family) [Nocardiopsis sp. Huas11]
MQALIAPLLALALLTPLPADDPTGTPSPAAMDAYVRDHREASGVPGLAYAVVGPDGIEHQGLLGRDGAGAPVTEETPFLWGSVAKPVAATAALVLADEGRLDLDAPVEEYLPDFAGFGARPTVRDLLTQTSGLTEAAAFPVSDRYGADAPDTGERVRRIADSPVGEPGTHEYSSANYLALGAVIGEVAGGTDAYLRASVLDPAGMDGAFTSSAEAEAAGLAPGHRVLWGVPVADADGVDDAGAAFGYLGGGLTDIAAFARLQLRADPAVLDADALARARTGAVPVPGSAQQYGFGWRETHLSGTNTPIVFHGGATPGHAALLVLLPEQERAVVVLQNHYDVLRDGQIQGVAFGLARLLSGAEPDPTPGFVGATALPWAATAAALVQAGGVVAALRAGRPHWAVSAAWTALGLGAVGAAAWLLSYLGPHGALTWLPDTAIALLAAAVLGTAVTAVRLTRHLRPAPR